MKLLRQLRSLFRRDKLEAQMAEEMRLHLEMQAERNRAAGLSADEARFAALREFGNVGVIQQQARERRGWVWLEQSLQDLQFAARQLRKAPGFATTTILTFALGIGATTTIFSIVYSVILRPLDFPDSTRLVVLRETYPPDGQADAVSWAAYYRWMGAASFQSVGAARFGVGNLTGAGDPERATTLEVTPNYFATLGVLPVRGRSFRPGEVEADGASPMLLSHAFWLRKFGGAENAVGRTVQLSDRTYEIAGVLPPNEQLDNGAGVFILAAATAAERGNLSSADGPDVVARLKPGVSPIQAEKELAAMASAMAAEFPATNKGHGVKVIALRDDIVKRSNYGMLGADSLLLIFLGAVGLLLGLACTNVANLLLARAGTRRREIATRAALGASRGRIIRQLLCESTLISTMGGILGLLFAQWSLAALRPLTGSLPRAGEIAIHGGALGYSLAIIFITSAGFGLVPALHGSAPNLIEGTKGSGRDGGGRRTGRLRTQLITAEVMLAVLLLGGAGLLINSFIRLQRVNLGFRPDDVLANRLEMPAGKYGTPQQQAAFVAELAERIRGAPGVDAVAFTSGMPIFGSFGASFRIAGRAADPQGPVASALYAAITPDYFKTVDIALVRGRTFTQKDSATAPRLAIISASLAGRCFPNVDPIGKQIALTREPDRWRTIVGIAADVKQWGPASDMIRATPGQLYEPFSQNPTTRNLLLVVHAGAAAADLPVALRTIIQSVDPNMPLTRLFRLADGVSYSAARFRFSTLIGSLFAGMALLIAAIGVYGVVSYGVVERTHEFGVRLALGAGRGDILLLIFEQTGKPVGIAVLAGLGGALAGGRLLKSLLFEVNGWDPTTLGLVTMVLLLVVSVACWLPARRAARVDPVIALRTE